MLKYLTILILVTNTIAASNIPSPDMKHTIKLLEKMLVQKKSVSVYKFQDKLALENFIGHISKYYAVDKMLLLGIIRQESAYCRYKLNKTTGDVGCMQIHKGNIKAHNWNYNTVLNHDAAGIVAGAIILRDFKKQFAVKEPGTWACRYNIGYRNMPQQCLSYLNKISK